jgi:pimeloyl-ACP methyl ester carboxylesterase
MEPFRVHLELPTLRLAALDYGPPAAGGPDLLMLHGQADLAWSMDPVARRLAGRYRVVTLDLRGHGESDHPGAYSLAHFIGDVRAVIELLALERPVLVGHSLGGQIAAQFSGLFPEVPRALVVAEGIGPPVRMGDGGPAERLARGRQAALSGGEQISLRPMADREEAAARLRRAHPGLDDERASFLAGVATRPTGEGTDDGVTWKFDPYTRHWLLSHDPERAEERWAAVRCPVLVVTGADAWERWWKTQSPAAKIEGWSGFDPDEIARRVGRFADVEHHDIPGAGHMLPYDAPDELAGSIIEFLRRRLGPI